MKDGLPSGCGITRAQLCERLRTSVQTRLLDDQERLMVLAGAGGAGLRGAGLAAVGPAGMETLTGL